MNPPRASDEDYINFLLASQGRYTCTEAARSQPDERHKRPSHDAFTRLLLRQPQDTGALWGDAEPMVSNKDSGVLVLDDSTLDKPYSKKIALVTNHWSGKHHRVVMGINLITLLWTDGKKLVPTDYRIYDKPFGGKTKNEHFGDMLYAARERGLNPDYTVFDSWYTSLDNLKQLREMGWRWFARLKENRLVVVVTDTDVAADFFEAISEIEIPEQGKVVQLKDYGPVKVFRTVRDSDGEIQYWATDDLKMDAKKRDQLESMGWGIEVYHRGIKQCCGIEKAQVRAERSQRAHVLLSLRAFLRLEVNRLVRAVSWYEAKFSIIRAAISAFLAHPTIGLSLTA
jgi:putative transposase